jgi:hypothetical protein
MLIALSGGIMYYSREGNGGMSESESTTSSGEGGGGGWVVDSSVDG